MVFNVKRRTPAMLQHQPNNLTRKKKQNSKRTFDELTRHTEAHWKQLKVFQSDNRFKNYN